MIFSRIFALTLLITNGGRYFRKPLGYCTIAMSTNEKSIYVRSDGLTISYDPFAPEMIEKYGSPGDTDSEGFNPYTDTVGPGIYGGRVKRDERSGEVLFGRQYQDHNPNPGPIYAGGGYTPMTIALREGEVAMKPLLDKYPELVNETTTGGATPLHMCGMSREGQHSTAYLISLGANVEAVDTYGYTPLHRMASNDLEVGAEALLSAGANLDARTPRGETALSIARQAGAGKVIAVLKRYQGAK